MNTLYTCDGKGGTYEMLGTAKGAGTMAASETLVIYRDTTTGALYFRTMDDFTNRMQQLPALTVERRRTLVDAPLPLDVQSALEQSALMLSNASQAHENLIAVIQQHLPGRKQ